jgi:hypothetical protein
MQSFFQVRPTDRRFEAVRWMQFYPVNSLSGANQIQFVLPRYTGPNTYVCNSMLIEVGLKLTQADGTAIPKAKSVAPINNIVNSIFKTCRVYVGETLISRCSENYHIKSFIIDLLSYDGEAKFSWLMPQGWHLDTPGKASNV